MVSEPAGGAQGAAHGGVPDPVTMERLRRRVNGWYAQAGRALPWREQDCSPWGVLLSEVMAQQTPLSRVEPVWRDWMEHWPTPSSLAAAAPGEAVRAWGRLGYPRRALRLHEAATVMVERHRGEVPNTPAELLALPGVGAYTAAAVASFAFRIPEVVVDTNVRRVLARTVEGKALPHVTLTRAESDLALRAMPAQRHTAPSARAEANVWNVAVMELGALVCVARGPRCADCPVADLCAWNTAGRPAYDGPPRRGQAWHGTDRQVRGEILRRLREQHRPVHRSHLDGAGPDPVQVLRCLDSLVADGLVEPLSHNRFRLPA
ncbi:A/G-specific adenine glycosylase [Intrasporangium calvum]|uniref:Adenine DNA glycosylase n=1 Tax=Intrasporangium calvum (strain ATCC 23552 / DSM 43043 / JCM 3097 / NBRC 12989 / NCIMB 10167 / NRRL B-3866 / 7 KIP) TaxID=710696 RepID=E6S9Y7_INTC7|nr:A/G-specific DNA-adenine glycosylase [Intrasporangium calvum DSM 43043]